MPAAAHTFLVALVATSCVIIFLASYFRTSHNTQVLSPDGIEPSKVTNQRKCQGKEKNHVFALVKVAKTGSSTLYTIAMRFALLHKLNVILPKQGTNLYLERKRGKCWDIGPESQSRADVMFNHVIYNETRFGKFMKPNYKMIFSVREQVSWFKSAVKFNYGRGKTTEMSPEKTILDDKWKSYKGLFHLRQLKYLGFNPKNSKSLIKIQEYMSYAVPKIDIPVLNDKFDASLVMLKRRFCWDYIDIFYQKSTVTNSSSMELSEKAAKRLLSAEFNKGDQLLYRAVEKLWWEQPEVKEPDFWDEVSYFTSLNKRVATEWCSTATRNQQPYVIHSTQFHDEIELTVKFCRRLRMDKSELFGCITNYVYGTKVLETTIC